MGTTTAEDIQGIEAYHQDGAPLWANLLSGGSYYLGGVHNGLGREISDASAAAGDTASMGLTGRIRVWAGYDDVVDRNSTGYRLGQVAGIGISIGTTFINPCNLATGVQWAYRGLQGAQAADGVFNAAENIRKENYWTAAFDLLGVAGNISQKRCQDPFSAFSGLPRGFRVLAGGLFGPEFAAEQLASLDAAADGFVFRLGARRKGPDTFFTFRREHLFTRPMKSC